MENCQRLGGGPGDQPGPGRGGGSDAPAILVGFAAEAKVARLLGWHVTVGGGNTAGAEGAARRLIAEGASGIVSFGVAAGLDPALPAGRLIVANAVAVDGTILPADPALSERLGGMTGQLCLGLDRVVATAEEKRRLHQETGAALADMESGAVARAASEAGVPFAVLRAICDTADRTLPPAALVALDPSGQLGVMRIALSLLARPGQIGALLALARDAAAARRALRAHLLRLAGQPRRPEGIRRDGIVPEGIL